MLKIKNEVLNMSASHNATYLNNYVNANLILDILEENAADEGEKQEHK